MRVGGEAWAAGSSPIRQNLRPIFCSFIFRASFADQTIVKKKSTVKKSNKRGTKVFIGLTALLTLTAGLLLVVSPAPLKPDSTAMLAIDPSAPSAVRPPSWQYVYLHHSRANVATGQGDHFLIQPDGTVEATQRWRRQMEPLPPVSSARMPGNAVSIQLVGDFDQLPPTQAQLVAAQQLTNNLRQQYRIPASNILLTRVPRSVASHGTKFPTEAFKSAMVD